MKTQMQRAITDLLYLNGLFAIFSAATDFHLRLKNAPWLPLVIERHGEEVSITHYVEQNGDQLRDPEMVFSLREVTAVMPRFEGWAPKSVEPGGFGRLYRTLHYTEYRESGDVWPRYRLAGYYKQLMREAYAFANMWAKNLRAQKFIRRYAPGAIESLTHPRELDASLAQPTVAVPIRRETIECAGGVKMHEYYFAADLPRALRRAGYRQAEAALLHDFPHAASADYSCAVTGQGHSFTDAPLPPCTCSGGVAALIPQAT